MNPISIAINNARLTLSILVFFLIAGALAYQSIPKEAEPDVAIPIIYVSLGYQGISPEDSERMLLRPVETSLKGLAGVKEMRSSAYQGGGFVLIEFQAGYDFSNALEDVRAKVNDAKRNMPDGADEPSVHEVNISEFPVLVVTLSGDLPERVLSAAARQLRDAIEEVPGVLEGSLQGARDDLVEVIIDPVKLTSYGLQLDQMIQGVNAGNSLVAAGALEGSEGRFPVRVPSLIETVEDVANLPIVAGSEAVVRARDLATIRQSFKDAQTITRLNGQPAIAIEVKKRVGANLVDTVDAVKVLAADFQQRLPEGTVITFSQDKSDIVRTLLSDLQNHVLIAVILVFIVILYALSGRSSIIIGMAIPASFLMGIFALSMAGYTINIVVLFSLILAVGMLVDDAIIVTEYAESRMAEGMDRRAAFELAAHRMAGPVIAATATRIAAFSPLLFWPGIVGEFMKYLPITLIVTLTASLIYALLFAPTIGAMFAKAHVDEAPKPDGLYMAIAKKAVAYPKTVLLLALGILVGVQYSYSQYGAGVEFFPDIEPEQAQILIHARGNYSIEEKTELVLKVEREILSIDAFDSVYSAIGTQPRSAQDKPEDIIASITLEFKDWDKRPPADAILAEIVERSRQYPGIIVEPQKQEAGPPVGKPVAIEISAIDLALLEPATQIIRAKFDSMQGLANIEDSRPVPGIQWAIDVDRAQASKFGIDISMIGNYVRLVTNGLKVTEYRPDDSDEEIDIVVRFPAQYRHLDQLGQLRIQTGQGLVPVTNFITERPEPRVGELKRVDGRRIMSVKADVQPGVLADDKVRELRAWLPESGLDPRVQITFKGEDKEQNEAQQFLLRAFAVALFIMAIILLTQFNSFYSAFLILSAVILSTIGVMIGLLVMNKPFGIVMSGVGVIALAGIVVNNNIILIDTYDQMRKQGLPAHEALLRTGAQRLRPVFLTTVTTILGLMPMVMQVNIDFLNRTVNVGAPSTQWWVQLSTAIVFGLAFATILTLIITPSALKVRANVSDWRARRRQKRAEKNAPPVQVKG